MVKYRVEGTVIKDLSSIRWIQKPFKSKKFKTQEEAIRFGYSKVYRKDGNTKRTRNVLTNYQIKSYLK